MSVGHVEKFEYSVLLPDGKRNSRVIKLWNSYVRSRCSYFISPFVFFMYGLFNDSVITTEWVAANDKVVSQ